MGGSPVSLNTTTTTTTTTTASTPSVLSPVSYSSPGEGRKRRIKRVKKQAPLSTACSSSSSSSRDNKRSIHSPPNVRKYARESPVTRRVWESNSPCKTTTNDETPPTTTTTTAIEGKRRTTPMKKNKTKQRNSPIRGVLRVKDSGRRLASSERDGEFLRGPVFYSASGYKREKVEHPERLSHDEKMRLIEALRREQNEELLTILNTEQEAESKRIRVRAKARTEPECQKLDRRFARERVETSQRIMSLTERHEKELGNCMKMLGISSIHGGG